MSSHAFRNLKLIPLAALACLVLASSAQAQGPEGSFERTLTVSGPVDLSVQSGSGGIKVHPGPAGSVRISARIRANRSWFSGDASDRIRQIEQNPPIEQSGNSIRVGGHEEDRRLFRNISIHYDVTVPADTAVKANTGSGSVEVGDLRGAVEARSGSGSIEIGRVDGPVVANTGSGSIDVGGAQGLDAHAGSGSIKATGVSGDVKANSGSGSVDVVHVGQGNLDVSSSSGGVAVRGVDGAARVSSSSGSVEVEGRPSGPWNIHSSSGGVVLRLPSDAAFDLDAHVGSGRINSDHPVTVAGSMGRQRLQGKVRGGGALVEVRSSSGGIRIE